MKNNIRILVGFILLVLVSYHDVDTLATVTNIDPRMSPETIQFVQKYISGLATLDPAFAHSVDVDNYEAHKHRYPQYYKDVTQVNLTASGTSENGNYNIPLTAFVPKGYENSRKLFVFIPGGAFISGSVYGYTPLLTHLAGALRTIFIYVGYRLAPVNGYPDGSNDCLVATKYIIANKNTLFRSLGCEKIALLSSSSGGNYALYVANTLTKREIAYHITIYPAVAIRPEDQIGGTAVEFNSTIYYVPIYITLGYIYYANPAIARYGPGLYNLTKFTPHLGITRDTPKTKIISAELDPLLDQGQNLLKNALIRKGVYVEQNTIKRTIHGLFGYLGLFPKAFSDGFELMKDFIARN